jgi:ATP-dependent DNA helicase RecQ
VDALYDFLAEQRREKFLGNGFFLGTIHSTKGMEFPHVVILDGDWAAPTDQGRIEEERRTLYVGMTRAKETLAFMKSQERPNPFLRELKGDSLLFRKGAAPGEKSFDGVFKQYEVLGLNDVYLSYAGMFPQIHPIHLHLSQMKAGDRVSLAIDNPSIKICNQEGYCVGKLSQGASAKWKERLAKVTEVRVVAMVKRDNLDEAETYRDRIKAEEWEVPVLEVVFA